MSDIIKFPGDQHRESRTEVVPYDDNPDFNDALDSEVIEIVGSRFQPSLVLHTMDPGAYREALLQYRQQKLEDLKDVVINRFPTPIASRLYKVEHGWATELERLSVLKDTWEAIILTLYALMVGEFRCLALPLDEAKLWLPSPSQALKYDHLYSDKLAQRIAVMLGLVHLATERTLDTIFTQLVSLDVLEHIRSLNRDRNGLAHDETKSEEQARDLFTRCYEEVLDVLRQLQGLESVTLLRFHGSNGHALAIRFESFVGHATDRHFRKVEISPAQHRCYARFLTQDNVTAMYQGRFYSTSPFLHFVSREEGHVTKLCFYKKQTGEGSKKVYQFSVIGESCTERISGSRFATESNELRHLLTMRSAGIVT